MGDGGSGNDPEHRAQNPASLLGKMLRLDVSGVADSDPAGYRVPADNPFVSGSPVAAFGEIWAFGLRNPWQFSFDTPARGGTGALIIGDVGQSAWEEIDYEPAGRGGRNYGWRNREGAHDNVISLPPAYLPLTDPIFEVSHPTFQSITGGWVYRGVGLGPAFRGRYIFADFITGQVWSIGLSINGQGEATVVDFVDHTSEFSAANPLGNISSIGQDANGELYLVNYAAGTILRIDRTTPLPSMSASTATLRFAGSNTNSVLSPLTGNQQVTVGFSDSSAQAWTATADQPWMQITSGSGTGAGQFTVGIINPGNTLGIVADLSATITVTAAGASNSPVTIPVSFSLKPIVQFQPPFGVFDTPVNGATGLQGSFAVTGWALDDLGIDRVELWRDPVVGETTPTYYGPGQPGHGKIFIANPTFISGSRPDVQALFGGYPFADRAGWGYLLLSWGLWNQGNGSYTFHAVAYDVEGHSHLLGTKTVTVANASANRPFGAIDTPSFGGTVSGAIWNYGWALTPNTMPTCTITNGSVLMAIDSGPLLPVNYGDLRSDIAAAFPGFSNATTAGGAFFIDTTTLTNGRHQIGWLVTDNCGRQDGIGSRFFTVLNAAAAAAARPVAAAASSLGSPGLPALSAVEGKTRPTSTRKASGISVGSVVRPGTQARAAASSLGSPGSSPAMLRSARVSNTSPFADPVFVRHQGGEWAQVDSNSDGALVVDVKQGDRIEVQLPLLASGAYETSQEVMGERCPLPLGSSLDAKTSIFYWQPAPAFLGNFDLAFEAPGGEVVRLRVVVK